MRDIHANIFNLYFLQLTTTFISSLFFCVFGWFLSVSNTKYASQPTHFYTISLFLFIVFRCVLIITYFNILHPCKSILTMQYPMHNWQLYNERYAYSLAISHITWKLRWCKSFTIFSQFTAYVQTKMRSIRLLT